MIFSGILQGTAAAASAGVGCGSCCSSGISAFLPGYLVTHTKSMRESLRAFFSFYLGKILAVAALCTVSSCFGRKLMDESGKIGFFPVEITVDLFMLAMGAVLIVKWMKKKKEKQAGKHACASCGGHCASQKIKAQEVSYLTLFGMGAGYGISPCAPLLMIAGVSASIPPLAAVVTGSVFAMSSAVAPFFILALLSGLLSPKMRKELPDYLEYFQLLAYVILIAVYTAELTEKVL